MKDSQHVLISPFSRPLRNGKRNPKDYPYWDQLIEFLTAKGFNVIQIGRSGEKPLVTDVRMDLPLSTVVDLMTISRAVICVDNFCHHLASLHSIPCIVLWGKSDPNIFGYSLHINLLKDRMYLRKDQFDIWEKEEYDPNVFVPPEEILTHIE